MSSHTILDGILFFVLYHTYKILVAVVVPHFRSWHSPLILARQLYLRSEEGVPEAGFWNGL